MFFSNSSRFWTGRSNRTMTGIATPTVSLVRGETDG